MRSSAGRAASRAVREAETIRQRLLQVPGVKKVNIIDDLAKIKDTPIVAQGRTLRLADIADVRRGYENPPTFLIRNQGEPTIEIGVVMRDRWNGLELGRALTTEVAAISSGMPVGLSLTKVTDQAVNIREAINEFMLKFVVALAVVVVVSLLSLGWHVGIVVAAAVPSPLRACSW